MARKAHSVSVTGEEKKEEAQVTWMPTPDEEKRKKKWMRRLHLMMEKKNPAEIRINDSLALYSGRIRAQQGDVSAHRNVLPFARPFVDAKTTKEAKAQGEYKFIPQDDEDDEWRVDFLKDVNKHIWRVNKWRSKKRVALRMKNKAGLQPVRIGFKKIMRDIKEGVEYDEEGNIVTWKNRPSPMFNDIVMELVSPLNFLVDDNATTIDDAGDCAEYMRKSQIEVEEQLGHHPLFKNFDAIMASPMQQVDIVHCYSVMEDEQVIYMAPAMGDAMAHFGDDKISGMWVETMFAPLPDDHKMLPFAVYHNASTHIENVVRETITQAANGEAIAEEIKVSPTEGFYTVGDPFLMMELVDLRTEFGRSAFRAMALKGQAILATKGRYSLDTSHPWETGWQAIGGMGKIEAINLGANVPEGTYDFIFNDLLAQMIMLVKTDPRNLSDLGKTKSATEAAINAETEGDLLGDNIEFNEDFTDTRIGELVHKTIQHRYTKPELTRLTGDESKEELESFDEVETDPNTGKPFAGKSFRRIRSSRKLITDKGGNISERDRGVNSFISRPQYIRTSNVDIGMSTTRRVNQLRIVVRDNAVQMWSMFIQGVPLTRADPTTGTPAFLKKEDLPDPKKIIDDMMETSDYDEDDKWKPDGDDEGDLEKERRRMNETRKEADDIESPPLGAT